MCKGGEEGGIIKKKLEKLDFVWTVWTSLHFVPDRAEIKTKTQDVVGCWSTRYIFACGPYGPLDRWCTSVDALWHQDAFAKAFLTVDLGLLRVGLTCARTACSAMNESRAVVVSNQCVAA